MPQPSSRAYDRYGSRIPRQFTRAYNRGARRTVRQSSHYLGERNADGPAPLADTGSSLSPIIDRRNEVVDYQRVSSHAVEAALTHSVNPSQLYDMGHFLLSRFENLGHLDDLERAIAAFQNALELTSDDDTINLSRRLQWFGASLRTRFLRLGELDDLGRAIIAYQNAVDIMPEGHPEVPARLHSLGASLGTRFEHIGELADLERAIALFRNAIHLTPIGHPGKPVLLVNLGITLLDRFRHVGGLPNTNEAIANYRHADELTPEGHPDKPRQFAALGDALLDRFRHLGDLDDLERAIETQQRAVKLTPEGHPDKPQRLAALGTSLGIRFQHLGELDDLERAIETHQRAVKLTPEGHPDKPLRLAELGTSLAVRFQHLGELDDLERAIGNHQHAIELTPEGHPDKPLRLGQLGVALLDRFRHLGKPDDLELAIKTHQRAVELTPEGHPGKTQRLAQLGVALLDRFRHLGKLDDLEHAIVNYRHADELTPEGHPDKPRQLAALGDALLDRFRHLGDLDDLERAIETQQRAVKLTPEGHPDRPARLQSLGASFGNRFQHLGKLGDLEQFIAAYQHAVDLTPEGHPAKPDRLHGLGMSLLDRFRKIGERDDLDQAIATNQKAVELTPEGHPNRPPRLQTLGTSLLARFLLLGELVDLECTIVNHLRALELTPVGHPDRVARLRELGSSLSIKFQREPSKSNFDAALDRLMEATVQSSGRPSLRLESARECAILLFRYPEFGSEELLLSVHSRAMDILPESVWLGHSVSRRYLEATRITSMVSTAVYVAIRQNALSQAIEWLEAGRSLIWNQVHALRTPFHEMKETHPELAEALEEASKQLQGSRYMAHSSTSHEETATHIPNIPSTGVNITADRHRRFAIQYDHTLREIRRCTGFEDFMRPPKFASLLPGLKHLEGPVVFINTDPASCEALTLLPDGTLARVKLPDLTAQRASKLRSLWMQSLEQCHTRVRRAMRPDMNSARGGTSMFGRILARLWTWVVQPILKHLNLITSPSDSARLPHITWCPTGPLTQLPLHAAGIYGSKQQLRVFDFVVSSYTPSLSALLRCSQGLNYRSSQPNMLVVAQPATPGLTQLPGTKKECARIRAIVPDNAYTLLEHNQAVVAKTAAVIGQYPWVHFACHGVQDATDPTQSAFALYDGPLTLSMLMGTVADNAELAFLSACQTAVGDEKIPEESAHLAAGMLVVGFKGVIATMWSIGDEDAPIVAEAYYKKLLELRSSGAVGPGRTGAAYALHEAVKVLREQVGEQNFVKWAPFVHFGV